MQGLLYQEDSFGIFLLVTLVLGGAGAWLSGRAIARTWRPWWMVLPAMLLLGFAVRFIHFALFEGTLMSPWYYAVDTTVVTAVALAAFRSTRRRQMVRQYGFLIIPAERDA